MSMTFIPRRSFLKGMGVVLTLPFLESIAPRILSAAPIANPKRMGFVYAPNGAIMEHWTPTDIGDNYKLPHILEPLESVKKDLLVVSGLAQDKAKPNGDGPGDHARASATFLTCAQAKKTGGADIKLGISVDQIAAKQLKEVTKFGSLEVACDASRQSGACDSGYACAYQYNISWRDESTPLPAETNPKFLFEKMFAVDENREEKLKSQRSILDFVLEDAKNTRKKLSGNDQGKMDEYLNSVREIELRLEKYRKVSPPDDFKKPDDKIPEDFKEYIRLMYDLQVLAFQTDSTRVSSFLLNHDGSNKSYPFLGISEGHHELSHHQNNQEKKDKITKINRFHIEQFAYFIEKLKSIKEGDGTLLDNCTIVYGSGISDGNRHTHNELPVLIAGQGGGNITTGRHIRYAKDTPMGNLYLSMLDNMGVTNIPRIGDSTGRLTGLL